MPLGRGERLGEEFADGVGGETRPGGKEVIVDCLGPGGDGGTESGPMEEIDEVRFGFLGVGTVGVVLIGGVLPRESVGGSGSIKVDVP